MPQDVYGLSEGTLRAVERVIGTRPGDNIPAVGGQGSRQVTHIKITGALSGGFYPCVPTAYNAASGSWDEYAASLASPPNGETLANGKRYLAVRYGIHTATGKALYKTEQAAATSSPTDCSAVAFLDGNLDCLGLSVSGGTGRCKGLDTNQYLTLYPDGEGHWVSSTTLKTPGTADDVVTTQCPHAPRQWVFTFTDTNTGDACYGLAGNWTLTFTSGNTWTGTLAGNTATLVIASGVMTVTFSIGGSITYSAAITDCTGDNVLSRTNAGTCSTSYTPASITLKPAPVPPRKWTVQFTPPNCTTPYPKLALIGHAPGGSGTPPVYCPVWVGCQSTGTQFVAGGSNICGNISGGQCNSGGFTIDVNCGGCWGYYTPGPCWTGHPVPKTLCMTMACTEAGYETWNQSVPLRWQEGIANRWNNTFFAGGVVWHVQMLPCSGVPGWHVNIDSSGADPIFGGTFGMLYDAFPVPTDEPFTVTGTMHPPYAPSVDITYTITECADLPAVPTCCGSELEENPDLCLLVPGGFLGSDPDEVITLVHNGVPLGGSSWSGSIMAGAFSSVNVYATCVNGTMLVGHSDGMLSSWCVPTSSACLPLDATYNHACLCNGFPAADCVLALCA